MTKLSDFRRQRINANRHTDKGTEELRESIQRDGWIGALTVAADGETFDGSNRLTVGGELANQLEPIVIDSDGTRPIIVRRTDIANTDDLRAKRLGFLANHIQNADYNPDADIVAAIVSADAVMEKIALSDEALRDILQSAAVNQPPTEDEGAAGELLERAAELQEKWRVARGDVWEVGRHRIMCGDSTCESDVKRLMGGEKISTVIFDPPFDADEHILSLRWDCQDVLVFTDHRHFMDCTVGWKRFRSVFVWDGITSWYVPTQPLARARFAIWFGESNYNEDGWHYGVAGEARTIHNTRGSYHYKPDPRGKHLSTVFQSPNVKESEWHQYAKPLDWISLLIANCTNGIVYDGFMGSGTALVACEQTGRIGRGMEILEANCAVTLERLSLLSLECKRAEQPLQVRAA